MSKQSDVVRVTPQNLSLEEELPNNNTKAVVWMATKRLVLPISSLLFTLIFWTIGLIASYYSGAVQDSNMFDCLVIDLYWWKNNFLFNINLMQYLFVNLCPLVQYMYLILTLFVGGGTKWKKSTFWSTPSEFYCHSNI